MVVKILPDSGKRVRKILSGRFARKSKKLE